MQFENVILLEQQTAAEARAEAQAAAAEARAAAAQARAEAQEEAARVRVETQELRDQIRNQVREQIRIGQGQRGEPVIVVPPPQPWQQHQIPPQIVDILTMFAVVTVICIIGLPIARALGRWIDRRGLPSPVNTELAAQITRIEQAVDSMSVEVERISEAQRFQAKLLSDRSLTA